MSKSFRTVIIRVTSENDTSRGLIKYSKSDILNNLEDWAGSAKLQYFFIEHEADEEISKTHYHIVIKFNSPVHFDTVKNRFPYGDIESARNLRASIQYLIHLNDLSKKQYFWADIVTNCKDMNPYMVQTGFAQEIVLNNVIKNIESGEIREYNLYEKIPIELFSKYKTRIENALTYAREKIYMTKDRLIKVVFLSGVAGTGKTSFAKLLCEKANRSYCVSSSSNDPMQDYKGEDALILDDLRDSVFSFSDLLKILDNHTKSTSKSRYHNKAFLGDLIIITSSHPLADWYFNLPKLVKDQLYRRVSEQYQFTEDEIRIFKYNELFRRYELFGKMPNTILAEKRKCEHDVVDVVGIMELPFTPLVEDILDKETKQISLDDVPQPLKYVDVTCYVVPGDSSLNCKECLKNENFT